MLTAPIWLREGLALQGVDILGRMRFNGYRHVGNKLVGGWLAPEVLAIVSVLDSAQRSKKISGAVAEIGVHHGKFFLGLNLLLQDGEHSVAIDVFGDQDLNVDLSGRGDLAVFRKNVERWSSLDTVDIHQGDSTKLQAASLRELARGDIRLFSVDGGHTESIVLSDMRLAEETLASGGVVVADDIYNEEWPEVLHGTLRYMAEGGLLIPFAIGFNKVFFCTPEYAEFYRETLRPQFEDKLLIWAKTANFAKYEVLVLGRVPRNQIAEWHIYRN